MISTTVIVRRRFGFREEHALLEPSFGSVVEDGLLLEFLQNELPAILPDAMRSLKSIGEDATPVTPTIILSDEKPTYGPDLDLKFFISGTEVASGARPIVSRIIGDRIAAGLGVRKVSCDFIRARAINL